MLNKIAVVGASSMVGSRFCELEEKNFGIIKADLSGPVAIDVTDQASVENFFKNNSFDVLILFSAYTDVDGAEKQRGDQNASAWKINVNGAKNISDAVKKFNKKLIFISTDFVFDGKNGPYSEDDPIGTNQNLLSWYGITKVEAENIIRNRLSNYLILRISYPYRGPFDQKDDIAKRMLRMYREGKLYPLFDDQIITPTFIDDIASVIELLLNQNQTGTFHIASPTTTTQYEFGREVIKKFGGDPNHVEKGDIEKFLKRESVTPRPPKGGLKVEKITKLGFTPTNWKDGIRKIYEQSSGKLI